jgi:CheY-like chemotaxis protein
VQEATDGAVALALALSEHSDLVIADILLPVMNGRSRRIRRTQSLLFQRSYGGRGRTRTCDLLRVKQARSPNTMIIEQIFLQETSN